MDVNQGGQRNNDDEDYHTRTSHVHNHGSMHEYNAVREQGNEMPIHEHNMMRKEHKMVHTEHMQMRKTFTLETDTYFLIEGIKISSVQGILLAVLFTFAITVLLDILKFMMLMQEIHKRNHIKTQVQKKRQTWRFFVTAIFHMLSVSLAYSMMLCIMTMNVWLMVSVVLGSGFAHFVMRPVLSRRLERQSEHSKDLNIERTDGEAEPLDHNDDQGIQQRRRRSTKTLSIKPRTQKFKKRILSRILIKDMGESDEINKEIQESETRMNHEHHHRSMHGHNFFSLKTDSDFLIEGIKISSVQGIILAMVFTFAIAICYDSTKYMMFVQDYQTIQDKKRKNYWRLFVKVISHMLSVSLAYIMMLCIMTMNVWLMVSMLLGSGFAHFVMRPVLSRKLERRLELSTELNIEPPAEAEPFNRHNNRKKNENSEM